MGFYGHIIKDPGQTQFYFDRKYSNLAELKVHETTDGIYIGRYVLVEYSEEFRFKGIALQNSNITKEDGSLYNKTDGIIEGDFVCIVNDKAVYQCTGFSEKDEIAIFNFIYKDETAENIDYYNLNYNVDNTIIKNIGRGYDSTVWQKVYFDDDTPVEKYVMIAELNSVTPTFKIITDAPTDETKAIEVRGDSTNLNYNIVMPAVWGFNLKSIDYNIDGFNKEKTKVKNSNNEFKISDVNDGKKYPIGQSDAVIKPNTKELIINLPSIGNAISNVWDVVYGESLKEGEKRPLIPEILDRTKVGDALKIYVDNNNGDLYRAVGENYIKLPADDNVGSLKALQLKMHHYLGTGEETPDENTVPGAISKVNNTNTKINDEWTTLKGSEDKNEGFKTIHGAIDELENTNTKINDEWTTLKGSENNNEGFKTIHGAIDELEQYLGNENSPVDFDTMYGAVKYVKTLAGNSDDINENTLHGVKNIATNLIGKSTDTGFDTMHGTKNELENLVGTDETDKLTYGTITKALTKANALIGTSADTTTETMNGAINVVNDLIGEKPTDANWTINTMYDALKTVNDLNKESFNADLIVEGNTNTVWTISEKNKFLDKDGNNLITAFVEDEINNLKSEILEEDLKETFNTLVEIQNWINGDGVNATELSAAIAAEADLRKQKDDNLQAQFTALDILNNKVAVARKAEVASSLDETGVAQVKSVEVNNASNAKKVGHSLSIQLNGGDATVYDGSVAKSININPSLIGAAASSHNHAASEITSGTLTVARGGTGVTSNPSMLTNLGSTTAASIFAGNPRPGVTGTLPIANGGTGATTAAAALTNLGLTATATELNYCDGVTSAIQVQLDNKSPLGCQIDNESMVLLWSGSGKSPSFTVADRTIYKYYLIQVGSSDASHATWIFVPHSPSVLSSYFRGIGGYEGDETGTNIYSLTGTVSDTTIKIEQVYQRSSYNKWSGTAGTQMYVKAVYGVK